MYTEKAAAELSGSEGAGMKPDTLELALLFDYYGDLLTQKQKNCFDLYYNQDLSLGEIAQEEGISRQGVHDSLARAESLLRSVEEKTGCMARERRLRQALAKIRSAADVLACHPDPAVAAQGKDILSAVQSAESMEE